MGATGSPALVSDAAELGEGDGVDAGDGVWRDEGSGDDCGSFAPCPQATMLVDKIQAAIRLSAWEEVDLTALLRSVWSRRQLKAEAKRSNLWPVGRPTP